MKTHRFLGKLNLEYEEFAQYLFYNYISDIYFYTSEGNFLNLRETLVKELKDKNFEIIVVYNVTEGLDFADRIFPDWFQNEKKMSDKFYQTTTSQQMQTQSTYGRTSQKTHDPTQFLLLEAAFSAINKLIRQNQFKTAVILERINNAVPQNTTTQDKKIIDFIQSWSEIENGNITLLTCDAQSLDLLPTELYTTNRSSCLPILIGTPEIEEIKARLNHFKRHKRLEIDENQLDKIYRKLEGMDGRAILTLLEECKKRNLILNLRTIQQLRQKTEDVWLKKISNEQINELKNTLSEKIKGQNYAIETLIKTFRQVLFNLNFQVRSGTVENKPLAFFFFAGPTGVGKTEIFRILAETFAPEVKSRQINMTEFREEHSASRLFGAPPGFVGYGKGELGQFLFENPTSIILFDEFEKAHPKIWANYLTMLEGGLTTGDGVKIDLSQTFLLFTSNAGAGNLKIILDDSDETQKKEIVSENSETVRNALISSGAKPELIGRFFEAIIVFNNITEEIAKEIIRMKLPEIAKKINLEIEFEQSVTDFLVGTYNQNKAYGARNIVDNIKIIERDILDLVFGDSQEISNKKIIVYKDNRVTKLKG